MASRIVTFVSRRQLVGHCVVLSRKLPCLGSTIAINVLSATPNNGVLLSRQTIEEFLVVDGIWMETRDGRSFEVVTLQLCEELTQSPEPARARG